MHARTDATEGDARDRDRVVARESTFIDFFRSRRTRDRRRARGSRRVVRRARGVLSSSLLCYNSTQRPASSTSASFRASFARDSALEVSKSFLGKRSSGSVASSRANARTRASNRRFANAHNS